jgi:3-deoxy-manno-octulosonate cytidylyltransferase (CMP-KDO synthetase)
MSRILGVVPARMAASRFPGKPLATLLGKPMLEHVYRGAAACRLLDEVVIATCDAEIAAAAAAFGARTVMTAATHVRASDRVAEAAAADDADIVVMIQGDEPMIEPAMIEAAVTPLLADPAIVCTNLVAPITSERDLRDPNTIKVVMEADGPAMRALYFSRLPIPTGAGQPFAAGQWHKQVCVIPFRREALQRFRALPEGRLERAESIDMLRFLEHGIPVHMVPTSVQTQAVDTPDDLARVERLLASAGALL